MAADIYPVYYKIVVSGRTKKLAVACMQSFDEDDYNIFINEQFDTEDEADEKLYSIYRSCSEEEKDLLFTEEYKVRALRARFNKDSLF